MAEGMVFVPKNTVFQGYFKAFPTLFNECLELFDRRKLMSLLTVLLTVELLALTNQYLEIWLPPICPQHLAVVFKNRSIPVRVILLWRSAPTLLNNPRSMRR